MYDKKLYGTATVGTKGQVVIPAEARDELDIKTGDRLYVMGSVSRKWIGLVKEEQLRELVEHITDNVEAYRELLNKE